MVLSGSERFSMFLNGPQSLAVVLNGLEYSQYGACPIITYSWVDIFGAKMY